MYRTLLEYVGQNRRNPVSVEYRANPRFTWGYHFQTFVRIGAALADYLLGTKEIPTGAAKKFELAARTFITKAQQARIPKDLVLWMDAHEKHIALLLSGNRWPDKQEAAEGTSGQLFRLGNFQVHNTLGLEGQKLAETLEVLQKADQLIERAQIPGLDRTLYGDVLLVGQIRQAKTLAWYSIQEDLIYLRPILKKASAKGVVGTLIHELAHRYYYKFLDRPKKDEWTRWDYQVGRDIDRLELPKVGDPLPFHVVGHPPNQPLYVVGYQTGNIEITGGSYIPVRSYLTVARQNLRARKYPTAYAATNASEHFAEATALYALGTLPEEHRQAYERIIVKGEPAMESLKVAMATYVRIDREEFEAWLDTLDLHAKWHLKPGRVGTYLLPLSDTVAVKISSSIGSSDDVRDVGKASMQLALVSLVTGQTINKKAQGQNYFTRTMNWKKNWKEGFDRMKDAYLKSQGFYDALAAIEDREAYKAEIINAIEAVPEWQNHNILYDFHAIADRGGILTTKQRELLDKTVQQQSTIRKDDPMLEVLRELYRRARQSNDNWLMDFTQSVAGQVKRGRPLTPRQQEVIDKNRGKYRVAERYLVGCLLKDTW